MGIGPYAVGETILSPTTAECFRGPLHTRPCGATLSQERVGPLHTRPGFAGPPSPRRGLFYAIYASRSDSFLTIREVMRNSTATKAKKPHWALVVSEVAMKS